MSPLQRCGAVVIGRNEGERLRLCLQSLVNQVVTIVYVDSGSTDNSLQIAEQLGVMILELDMSAPFTAARARNEGFAVMMKHFSDIEYIQFIDGDCQLNIGWVQRGERYLAMHLDAAIVCGIRRECFPDASVYNRLCDIEWDADVGEVKECGGDMLMRAEAFQSVHGFNSVLIAGEEPDLCVRLRGAGWKIHRLDCSMTAHDAAMFRFSQWWNRMMRAGHAFSEINKLHRESLFRIWKREEKSNWLWGLSLPILLIISLFWQGVLVCLLIYPLQILRIAKCSYPHRTYRDRALFAIFCMLAKLPLMFGQARYMWSRISGHKKRIIEYK